MKKILIILIALAALLSLSFPGCDETANSLNGTTWVQGDNSKAEYIDHFVQLMLPIWESYLELEELRDMAIEELRDNAIMGMQMLGITDNDFPMEWAKIEFTSKTEFTMYQKGAAMPMLDPKREWEYFKKASWTAIVSGTYTVAGDTLTLKIDGYTMTGAFNRKVLTLSLPEKEIPAEVMGVIMELMVFKKKE